MRFTDIVDSVGSAMAYALVNSKATSGCGWFKCSSFRSSSSVFPIKVVFRGIHHLWYEPNPHPLFRRSFMRPSPPFDLTATTHESPRTWRGVIVLRLFDRRLTATTQHSLLCQNHHSESNEISRTNHWIAIPSNTFIDPITVII